MPSVCPSDKTLLQHGATEKKDVIFSKRQASIQSEVGPLKSSYGIWGSAVSSPSGVQIGTPVKKKYVKIYVKMFNMVNHIFIFLIFWGCFIFTR